MRATLFLLLGAALLSLPLDATAQDRARRSAPDGSRVVWNDRDAEWIRIRDRDGRLVRGRVLERRDGRRIVLLPDGRIVILDDRGRDRGRQVRRGQGPSFCRSGAGHPVFGRRWCLERGFGLGRDRDRRDRRDRGDDWSDDRSDDDRLSRDRRGVRWDRDILILGDRRGRSDDHDSDDD